MVTGQQIVTEAREWVGTRFVHQASMKGIGCDCVGLIRGVADHLHLKYDRALWMRHANYSRVPNVKRMRAGLAQFMLAIDDEELSSGDVLFMEWRENLPMHLAIYTTDTGRATIIHALAEAGKVCEHGLTQPWPDRIVTAWRYFERQGAN